MKYPDFSPYPLFSRIDQDFSFGGGSSWNGGLSRRRFLKRTGGATVATLVAWHAASLESRAEGEPEAGDSAPPPPPGPFKMRLQSVTPTSGEDFDHVDFQVNVGGVSMPAKLWIEVLAAPPLGGFPEKMTSVDFGYSVIMTVAYNGQAIARKVYEVSAHAEVDTHDGALSSSTSSSANGSGGGATVDPDAPLPEPPVDLPEAEFTFETGGPTYTVQVAIDSNGSGGTTSTAANATITGTGVNATTGYQKVTHVFESFRDE
jgi:hypothetical protein